jgi:formylglycine-generating enzyme required for sulfatase activity
MSYCINPSCAAPGKNSNNTNFCMACGASLRLKDRYRAQKLLGQGGFGKTFKAVDEDRPGQPLCVIKQFAFSSSDSQTQQTALNLFYEEAKHLQSLGSHPQIPELLAYFDVDGQPYLVQQYIDGQDLEQEMATEGAFNQQKILELLESLLPVLDFLHNQPKPVIHRDIKPANIIRRRADGALILVDFGAAKQATQTMLAKTGTMIGSPEYAAPEQTRGKPTFASDIYSLGVTCIHLLTNVPPFDLFDISEDNWVWRDYLINNPVDELLGKVLDGAIINALARRYHSATEVLTVLSNKNKLVIRTTATPQSQPQINKLPTEPNLEPFSFEIAQLRIVRDIKGETKEIIVDKSAGQATRFFEDLGNGVQLEMVSIPGGEFLMGSLETEKDSRSDERPQHRVQVPSFCMGRYPVTQSQYEALVGNNPSRRKGINLPVEMVSWHDAQDFCQRLITHSQRKYCLPSEAQWEYACRAGTNTPFYYGETINTAVANYNGNYIYGSGRKGENRGQIIAADSLNVANSFGLYGMHGNVWEWCKNHYSESYQQAPNDGSADINPPAKEASPKVLRGGSWFSGPAYCRSAFRLRLLSDIRDDFIGFRVACSLSRII